MWTAQASALVPCTPEAVWSRWSDVARWKAWDVSLDSSALHGPFEAGTPGEMTPHGMDRPLVFALTEVVPLERFSDETRLPGATITFHHWLEHTPEVLKLTHQAQIAGEAWSGYAAQMGAQLEAGLRASVDKLAELLALEPAQV